MKSSLTAVLASASVAAAHMEMTWPPPFRSKFNPYSLSSAIDYTMTAPLLADGSNYPCKKYQVGDLGTPQGRPTASFAAGQSANVTIGGGAPHGGGSCQVSLSYDRGETFTVVQSIEGGCPASAGSTSLNFAIPYDAPQGDALLAWTWFNNLGNREMYMNCAAVTITGNSGKRDEESAEKRGARGPMNSRPKLFVANVGNGCSTVDSRDVQFPQPGPDLDVKSAQGAVAPRGSGCQSSVSGTVGNVDYAVASPNAQAETPAAASPAPASSSAAPAAQNSPQPAAPAPAPAAAAPANSVGTVGSDAAGLSSLASTSSSSSSGSSSSSSSANGATTAGTPCTSEGRWACLAGGRSFQRCASGQWSAVQAMAPGTVCRLGQSDNKFEIETAPVAVASRAETSRARLRQLLRSHRGE